MECSGHTHSTGGSKMLVPVDVVSKQPIPITDLWVMAVSLGLLLATGSWKVASLPLFIQGAYYLLKFMGVGT